MTSVIVEIFVFLVLFLAISWIFMIFEFISILRFHAGVFDLGPVVMRGLFKAPPNWDGISTLRLDDVCFSANENGDLLFRSRFRVFSLISPFPLKSKLCRREGGMMELEVRHPLASTVFIFFWVSAAAVLCFLSVSAGDMRFGIAMLIVGIGSIGSIFVASWLTESARIRRAVESVKTII